MKKLLMSSYLIGAGLLSLVLMSADHIDAPSVAGAPTDIADFYAFESPVNSQNMVFAISLQGLLSPMSTSDAAFSENVLIEFNIDNDGDNVEDLVIQAIPRNGKMYAFGPYTPIETGVKSSIDDNVGAVITNITTYGDNPVIGELNGIKLFAGPRDDPFFFDLAAYMDVLSGSASGFSNPGNDTFAGTNVMSIVVEVPKNTLGSAKSINTWVETKTKQ